ncbi:MAG TPA: sugar phosphate isomerase/epimerase family protein [Desulfatiglandales bacterium]|nr:sugar phosphate isomerase/epimerase family protein [Desulfatiglandales bacterium]
MLYGAMNFPVSPVLDELEVLSGLGFDYLELAMDPPQAHYRVIREKKVELLKALDRHTMHVVCHLPTFVSTADLTDRLRETSLAEVLDSLETAAELKPLKVVLHPSTVRGLGVFVMEQVKEYLLKSLELIVEKADHLGLCLCIENMFPQYYSLVNAEDFVEVFERFPTLRLTLDTGHGQIESAGRKRTVEFIERFADRLYHVHASDNLGKADDHLPIGAGVIDFQEVVKALKASGYDETVTFEVFSRDRDYLRLSKTKWEALFREA